MTDDERRLAEIERDLDAADPALAAALNTVSPLRRQARAWMALAIFGAALVFGGLLLASPGVVLLGTGCALVGSLVVMKVVSPEEAGDGM